jgi:threonine dehydratase
MLSLDLMMAARERIVNYVRHTPVVPTPSLRNDFPGLRLKLENLQVTGSFKARGVFNNLLQLDAEQRQRGVIAASGGNHGLALAYGAWRLDIPATIYLPATASADRVARVKSWGATVHQVGTLWDDAHAAALEHANADGLMYIHPFDADGTLAGQGTLGLELLEDLPDLDCVLIAIGGGGLIAGMAAAIKQRKPNVRIIGVEPIGAPTMQQAVAAGKVVQLEHVQTFADTLSPRATSESCLRLVREYVDQIVLVSDAAMVEGMRWLWRECNQLVEPSGAAVIAALQSAAVDISAAQCPVALICGGNAAAESVFTGYVPR